MGLHFFDGKFFAFVGEQRKLVCDIFADALSQDNLLIKINKLIFH
jgi:hypothetical protein